MANETSRVLTLVFTDLADSTALKTARGDQAVDSLISRHREHVARLAKDCAGRVIDWAGDGCFLTFETSSAAVVFALRLQQAHADEPDLPGVRIGVHLGEVTEQPAPDGGVQVKGLAVDVTARIESLAKPGQVLMSTAVHNSARQRLGVETFGQPILWQAHGTYELKGFDEPMEIREAGVEGVAPLEAPRSTEKAKLVQRARRRKGETTTSSRKLPVVPSITAVVVLLLVAAVAYLFSTRGTAPEVVPTEVATSAATDPIASIAVLPLDNLMNDPEQDYFADGMTEAITAELAKIEALRIISRTSVMQYKETVKTMPQIAAELGVEGLIEGSVLRDGEEVRITVQLIDGRTDTHMWSESYTNTITSVLQLQSEVALAIADAINVKLTGEERARIADAHTVDPEAHEAYLLGEHFRREVTEESLTTAAEYFEEAVRIDPEYPEAWAKLGEVLGVIHGWGYRTAGEIIPQARAAHQRALELDPDLAVSHAGLAWISFVNDREWEQSEERFKHALELSPNFAMGHSNYAWYLRVVGRIDDALRHSTTALDLDPSDPEVVADATTIFVEAGDPDRQRRAMEDLLASNPDFIPALEGLVYASWALDRLPEAIAMAERMVEIDDRSASSLLTLANSFALSGRTADAEAALNEALTSDDYVDSADLARVYVTLGRIDEAFEAFERAYDRRDWVLSWLKTFAYRPYSIDDPHHITFRNDLRFWDLVERVGFPPFPPEHPGYTDEQAWLAQKAAEEAGTAPINKIAVLPFINQSSDPEQEFFVDGMTEALISELAKVESLKVISRTSAMRYKGTDKSLPTITRELNVDAIVEGSVLKAGNDVRITAQLVRGATDEHLWASSYTNSLENILKLQAEVALAIAREIRGELSQEEEARLAEDRIVHPEAYEEYLMGRFFASRQSEDGFAQAAEYHARALEIDPNFADAHAALGGAHYGSTLWGWGDPREGAQAVREGIRRALELDPDNIFALSTAAMLAFNFDYDWETAEARALQVLAVRPDNRRARGVLARLDALKGRYEEAILESEINLDLDPYNPNLRDSLADKYDMAGRHEEALEIRLRTREIAPDHVGTHLNIAEDYAVLGRYDEALETIQAVEPLIRNRKMYQTQLAAYLAYAGRIDEAREILEQLESDDSDEYLSAYRMAYAWIAVGDLGKTLSYLEQAYEQRPITLWMLGTRWFETLWAPIWDDPRFQAFLDRMNFPEREDSNEPLPENRSM